MSTIPQSNNGKHPPPSSFPPSSFNSIRNAFLPPLTSVSQHSNTLTPLNHPQQSQHQHRPQFPQQTLPHPQAHHPPNHHFTHQSQQNISYLTAEHQQYVPNNHNPAQQHPQHFPQPRPNAYQLYQRPPYMTQNQLPHPSFTNSPQRMPQLPQPNFPKLKSTITQNQAKNNNTPPVQHPNHPNQGQVFIHQSGQPQQVIHQHQPNQQHFPNNLRSFNLNNIPPNNSNDLRQLKNVQILNQQQRLQQTQAHAHAQSQPQPTPPQPPTQQQQQTPQQQPQQQSQPLPQHHNQYQNHHNQNFQPQIPQNQHIQQQQQQHQQQQQQQHQQHQQHQQQQAQNAQNAQNAQEPPKKRAATGMQPWNNQSAPQNSQNNSSSLSANNTPTNARPMSSAGQPRTSILHPMNAVLSNPGLSNQFQHQHQQNMHMSAYDYEGFPYQVMPQSEHMNSQQYQNIPYSNGSSQHGDGNMVNRNLKVSNIQSQNLKPTSSPQFFKMQVSKSQNGVNPVNQAPVHNNGLKRDLSPHSISIPKPLVPVPAPAPTPAISQPKSAEPPKPQNPIYFPIHNTAPTPVTNVSTHIIKNSEVKIAPAPIPQNSEPAYNISTIPTKPQASPNQEPVVKPKFEPAPEPEPKPKVEENPEPQQPEQKIIKPSASERKSTSRPPTKVPNFPGRVPSHLLVTNEQRMQILNIETPKFTFGAGDQDKAKEYLNEHKLSKEFMVNNPLNKWKTRNTRRRKSIVTHLYQCCCGSDVRNFHGTKGVRKSKQKYPFVGCLAFVEVARKVDDDTILWVRGIMNHDEKCVAAMPNPQV